MGKARPAKNRIMQSAEGPEGMDPSKRITHNIYNAFESMTPKEVDEGARWFPDAHDVINHITGRDAHTSAGMTAIMSAQMPWSENMRALDETRRLGHAPEKGSGFMLSHDAMHSQEKNANRVWHGEDYEDVMGEAPKTRHFAHQLEYRGHAVASSGRPESPPIDRHAMSVGLGRRIEDKEFGAAGVDRTPGQEFMGRKYVAAARMYNQKHGTNYTPAHLFAGVWLKQQANNNWADEGDKKGRGLNTRSLNSWDDFEDRSRRIGLPAQLPGNSQLHEPQHVAQIRHKRMYEEDAT